MRPVTQRFPIDINSWNKGLITEASPINFPEGASLDEENFVLDRDGSRRRRFGMDYEDGYGHAHFAESATAAFMAVSNFLWENVDENPDVNYLVHQFGNRLYFFNADTSAVSANLLFGGPLTLTATTVARFSMATIQGNLIVVTGDQNIRIVAKEGTDTLTLTQSRLKVRDFWGVDDGLPVDERPSATATISCTIGARHHYNLYNQGWPPLFFCATEGTANPTEMNNGTNAEPVSHTYSILGQFPSNADIIYTAMTFFTSGRKAYFPYALQNIHSGNTPAPRGHYIIDLFDRSGGRSAAYTQDIASGFNRRENYTGFIPVDQSTGGIRATAAYAGRIWYACTSGEIGGDSRSPHVGTFVLFSRLVDSTENLSQCYQEADPTAEDISDLIDTDGGYLPFPDAVDIKALVPFKSSLLVFADNGVWEIAGGDRGFTATEYQSKFLTNNGALNSACIVVAGDSVMYWSRNGIYAVGVGQTGVVEVQSITESTIQTLYNDIPYNSKLWATGHYDDVEYRVRWLYQATYNAFQVYWYDTELILDLSIPAFSKFTIKNMRTAVDTPHITGYISVPTQSRDIAAADYKYSAIVPEASSSFAFTASYYKNQYFRDWAKADSTATSTLSGGADAAAFLVTGYIL